MAVSSTDVIKSVSKKLKYYFDIKRLEDGFDLSGVDCPRLDHPQVKSRPTLMYDGLHDRPLKHYFSPKEVRVSLTQFKTPEGRKTREKEIRTMLERYIRRYHFRDEKILKNKSTDTSSLPPAPSAVSNGQWEGSTSKVLTTKQGRRSSLPAKPSVLPDGYTPNPKGGQRVGQRRLRADGTGGGGPRKRRSGARGGHYTLRSAPPTATSRHEAERLVNIASRLLVATETIDVNKPPRGTQLKERGQPDGQKSCDRQGKKYHNVFTYDINGRRVLVRKSGESEDDSAYNSPPQSTSPNYVTITGDQVDDQVMPGWLRKELQRSGGGVGRRQSADDSPTPRPPDDDTDRPKSARLRPLSGRRHLRVSSQSPDPPTVKTGWGAETASTSGDNGPDDVRSSGTVETAVQTGGELLRNYEPSECILFDGEKAQYEVQVFTGDRLGAGTKADIKLVLRGDKGRTNEIHLKDSKTHKITFQRGQEDIFDLDTYFVGPIRQITIGHDRKELGFGWYLERVEVKDMMNYVKYVIPCERWLSSKETDQRTLRDFTVDYSMGFSPVPPPASQPDVPEPEQAAASYAPADDREETTSTVSHTSTATVYSNRNDQKETPRRRPSYSSRSSYTSSTSSYSSSSEEETDHEDEDKDKVKEEEVKPKPLPRARPFRRRDTFFDQKGPGQDYSSVLESLSQTTEQDTRERQDFEPDTPSYLTKEPGTLPLALREEDEDTAHLEKKDVTDPQEEEDEKEKHGTRLSLPVREEEKKPLEEEITPAPRLSQPPRGNREVRVNDSDTDSDNDELERGPNIHEAAKQGDLSRVKRHIEHNIKAKDATDELGWAPVHVAASYGHVDVIKWLAVSGANLDAQTPTGYSPMHLAAMQGHTNGMIVLNAMGAKLNAMSVEHQSALHVAAKGGYLESVKWLVANRCSLETADNMGRRPVDLAEEHNQQAVHDFLKLCAKEQVKNPDGSFAMMRTDSRRSLESTGKKSTTSNSDEDSESNDESDDSDPTWRDARPTVPHGDKESIRKSDEDTDSRKTSKHDEELMEKRALFAEQQRRMSEKNVTFLDSIRDEAV